MKSSVWAAALVLAAAQTAAPAMAHPEALEYLDAGHFVPAQTLPPPAPRGSQAEARELATLHRIVAEASPERLARARWDDAHEDPSLFNEAVGFDLRTKPATWELLRIVQTETALVADTSKRYFARTRPWGADTSLPNCDAGKDKKPVKSYPSGHATLGYSVGWVLARLMPAKADAILARAADYAMGRQVCGVHFPSDTEASHVLGTLGAAELWADPRLAGKIAAARAELAQN